MNVKVLKVEDAENCKKKLELEISNEKYSIRLKNYLMNCKSLQRYRGFDRDMSHGKY